MLASSTQGVLGNVGARFFLLAFAHSFNADRILKTPIETANATRRRTTPHGKKVVHEDEEKYHHQHADEQRFDAAP